MKLLDFEMIKIYWDEIEKLLYKICYISTILIMCYIAK